MYAIDASSGELRWQFQAQGRIASAPVAANGMVYVTSWDGYLYAIE